MKSILIKDKAGSGSWILILGCPVLEKHCLVDHVQDVSGPSFADCAHCEYQEGRDFENLGADGNYDGATISPDCLKCGYRKNLDGNRLTQ